MNICLQMIIKIPNIIVKLEGGVGKRSVPLLIAETSFDAQIKDWSSKVVRSFLISQEVIYTFPPELKLVYIIYLFNQCVCKH